MDKNNIASIFPLTTSQKGLLFHTLKEKETGAYIGQHMLYLKNQIDAGLFEKSLQLLAQRYEIFRTRVVYTKLENPVQVVLKESPVEFQYLEETDLEEFCRQDRARGFSVEKENLIRVALIRTGEDTWVNLWTFHHMLIDGYSIDILAKDFFAIYHSLQMGKEPELLPVPSYRNYVTWLSEQDIEKSKAYWTNYAAGVETAVMVPGDLEGNGGKPGKLSLSLSAAVSRKLAEYAASHQITVNAVMQALWGTVLAAYTGAEDFLYGSVMAAIPLDLEGADRMAGLFSGTYPVRYCCKDKRSFEEIAGQLNRDFLLSVQHACCPVGELPGVAKLIRSIYVFENFDLNGLYAGAERAGLEITGMSMEDHSNYEFSLSVGQQGENIKIDFRFDRAKYSETAIRTIRDDIEAVAAGICNGTVKQPEDAKQMIQFQPLFVEQVPEKKQETKHTYAAPDTEYEVKLAEIFSHVLGVEQPGIYDDFFEAGGDSISGMRFVAACEKEGLAISLKDLFGHPNIAELAKQLETGGQKKLKQVSEAVRYEPDAAHEYEPFPLNGIQSAYLMGINDEFELGGFSTQYYTEIEGDYDIPRLEDAMRRVIRHQAALRTVVEDVDSQRVQEDMPEFRIYYEDLSQNSENEREAVLLKWREKLTHSVFDPADVPYFKICAFRLESHVFRLCFQISCICIDGAGLMMMIQELYHYYEHPEQELPEITFTFRDYQMAQLAEAQKEPYRKDRDYWMQKADWLPLGPELPLVGNPEQLKNPGFLRKQHLFDAREYDALKKLCHKQKITMAALLCTAYMETLSFWSNSEEFSINMTVFERNEYHEDVPRLIGDFTKLIVVDTQMEQPDLLSQAAATTETIAEALEHSSYNCIHLIKEIAYRRHLGTRAVLPYVFTCALIEGGSSQIQPVYALSRTPQVYIDCQVTEQNGGLFVNWDYPEGLFEEEMMAEMFAQYVHLIAEASGNPDIQVNEETEAFIKAYNNTFTDEAERAGIQEMNLTDLFVPSFTRYADLPAVRDAQKEWTYEMLAEYTYKTVSRLKKEQVKPGSCVGVVGERKAETIAGILAVLLCGAAYVPLNEEFPEERVRYVMEKTKAAVKIDAAYVRAAMAEEEADTSDSAADAAELAYIIFTSGTTGRPKGVAIRHNSAVNTICDINKRCGITQADRFLCLAEFGFDLSVYDIFGSLSSGAKLCIVQNQKNPEEILTLLEQEQITFWNSVPAVMQMVTGVVEPEYRNQFLRHVYLSGDWIPLNLPDKIRGIFPQAEVVSLGGATEASIWSIYYPTEKKTQLATIPYGMPLQNQTIYILNRKMQICPLDVRGEICIGGDGVAMGYFGEKEKTEAAFVQHPKYGRIYRTGDYGRMHKEGYVEFLGRIDGQVKIRGFRVELGEIESCAMEYDGVGHAVAVNKTKGSGEVLALYIDGKSQIDTEALKQYLQTKLPNYMIPAVIIQMDKIPVTPNGKIDRKLLKQVELETAVNTRLEPQTELERQVGDIFRRILETQQIDYEQSFFEMGVDSLKAVMIINELKQKGYQVSLTDVYENNTIALLAEMLGQTEEVLSDEFEDGEI